MSETNVVVTDEQKKVVCGGIALTVYIGKFGYVVVGGCEVKRDEIPNLIAALHTAQDILESA